MILRLSEAKLGLWTALERVDRSLAPKREDHGWIYGTPYWEALTAPQRVELLWLEHAHTISSVIWFKEALAPLYTRLIQKYGERLSEDVRTYMSSFCEDEALHTRAFRRYLQVAGLPLFECPDLVDLIPHIEKVHPIAGIFCTYLMQASLEETLVLQDDDGIDPLTRRLMRKHHLDEMRHLAFGKWLCESTLEESSAATRARVAHFTRGYVGNAIRRYTYNPEICRHTSFDIGIDPADAEEIANIRRSENNRRLNADRYGPMLEWARTMGPANPTFQWVIEEHSLPVAHFSRWSQNGPFSAAGAARRKAAMAVAALKASVTEIS